jgi:hypothetical protein
MARYYNRTRGLVNVTLRTGESAVVAGKQYLTVTPDQDRSASILSRVAKKLLVPVEDAPSAPEPAPEPEPEPEPECTCGPGDGCDICGGQPEAPSMQWTKTRLLAHADDLGLEVPSSCTKVEILGAIEDAG